MSTLHLTLKKKWFDMILSGDKKEEYREIKPYWNKRFLNQSFIWLIIYNNFDFVEFKNGYGKHSPIATFTCNGIKMGIGKQIWGAPPNKEVYIISLGKIISTKNLK